MKPHRKTTVLSLLKSLLPPRPGLLSGPPPEPPSAHQRALDLIAAIDAGGVPLNPARVNDIARRLGLEVAASAPMDVTIERIRGALDQAAAS